MMKRLISLVLCVVLLLGCMTFAQAETQRDDNVAVDIVLLIDQSGSVWNGGTSGASDPDGLRLDAAAMVIAMLGNNGSRVAYVPFGSQVFANADKEFHLIQSENDYVKKIDECEELRNKPQGPNGENGGGTDFAEPLAYAYNLLANRGPDETNQPMIILLTDGVMAFTPDSNNVPVKMKPYYQWSDAKQRFEWVKNKENVRVYSSRGYGGTYFTEDLLKAATYRCRLMEYPVYTVALAADANAEHYQTLKQISNDTGATSYAINKGDDEGLRALPAYFATMFADRIGTSELKPLTVTPVAGEPNKYKVEFEIPNESVMEANIFFPVEGIVDHKIVDKDGKDPGRTLMRLKSGNFMLYKLVNPRPFGTWTLYFETTDASAADISFNLLYNYNVVLHGDVRERGNVWNPEGLTFMRGDKLEFRARFFDNKANNGAGGYKTDERLYSYPEDPRRTSDDWCIMNATYELYRRVNADTSESITSGKMDVDGPSFYLSLDMTEIKKDAFGCNALLTGDYYLAVHVEGSGLIRDVEIPFKLENTPPSEGVDEISLNQTVDQEPGDETKAFSLNQYIRDADNDRLSSTFRQTAGQDVARLEYDSEFQTLTATAQISADGKHRWGVVEGELTVVEEITGVSKTIPVKLNVNSANNKMFTRWNLKATADGKTTGAVLNKDTEFDITLELHKAEEYDVLETDAAELAKVEAVIRIENADTHETETVTVTANAGGIFTYQHRTGLNAGKWKVTVELWQKEPRLPIKTVQTDFEVKNHAPVAQAEPVEMTINFNALPDVLSFLGTNSTKEQRTLDMSAYFTDADNESLNYHIMEEVSEALLKIERDGDKWVLKQANGVRYLNTVTFEVVAYDNDAAGSDVAVKFQIHLVNLTDMWIHRGLMGLAALVAFIILVSIIRQIRKPKFPRATLGVREGNSDYDTSTYDLMPSKKPLPLAAVVMTDTAAKFGISANALTSIMLVPVRSMNGSIGVRLSKKLDGVSVALTTKGVGKGKKPTIWTPGDALILNSRNNTTGAELNVVLFPPEAPVPGGVEVNNGPFNLGGDDDFGGFNNDVNAFGANDISGSFGGFAPTDSFSAPAASDSGFGTSASNDNGFGESFQASDDSKDDFGGF